MRKIERPPRRSTLHRAMAALLAAVIAGMPALSAHAESSIWETRRNAAAPRRGADLAMLAPDTGPRAPAVLSAIPAAAPALKSEPALTARATGTLGEALALVPTDAGRVTESWSGDGRDRRLVLLLQDVHFHAEAQRRVAATLASLKQGWAARQEPGRFSIGAEAAFGPFDFAPYVGGTPENRRRSLEALLDKGRIGAVSFTGLSGPVPAETLGIDDLPLYRENVAAYLSASGSRKEVESSLAHQRTALDGEKRAGLSPALAGFDARQTAYRDGRMPITLFVPALLRTRRDAGVAWPDREAEAALTRFARAAERQAAIDFPRAESERRRAVERWAAQAGPDDLALMMRSAEAFRRGRMDAGDFYRFLRGRLMAAGVNLESLPRFAAYLDYVEDAASIDAGQMIEAVTRLEKAVVRALARTDAERALMARGDRLDLATRLVGFRLTPAEWEAWRLLGDTDQRLAPFRAFYEKADLRSEHMVEAALSGLGPRGRADLRAVVCGGFHAELMAALLKKRGVPYAVVQPVLTQIDASDPSAYLSAFLDEKEAVNRLFRGEKLFLGYFGVNVGEPTCDAMNPDAPVVQAELTGRPAPGIGWRIFFRPLRALGEAIQRLFKPAAPVQRDWRGRAVTDSGEDDAVKTSDDDTLHDIDIDTPEYRRREAEYDEKRRLLEEEGDALRARPVDSPEEAAQLLVDLEEYMGRAEKTLYSSDLKNVFDAVLDNIFYRVQSEHRRLYYLPPLLPAAARYIAVLLNSPVTKRLLALEEGEKADDFPGNVHDEHRHLRNFFLRALGLSTDPVYDGARSYFSSQYRLRREVLALFAVDNEVLAVYREAIRNAPPDVRRMWQWFAVALARDYNLPMITLLGDARSLIFDAKGGVSEPGRYILHQALRDLEAQRGPVRERMLEWISPALDELIGAEARAWFSRKIRSPGIEALLYTDLMRNMALADKRPAFNPAFASKLEAAVKESALPRKISFLNPLYGRDAPIVIEIARFDGMGDMDLALLMARGLKNAFPRREVIVVYEHVSPEQILERLSAEKERRPPDTDESGGVASKPAVNTRYSAFGSEPEKLAALLGIKENGESADRPGRIKTVTYPSGRVGTVEEVQTWQPAALGGLAIKLVPHTKFKETIGDRKFLRMPVMLTRDLSTYDMRLRNEIGVISLQTTAGPELPMPRRERAERGPWRRLARTTLIDLKTINETGYTPGSTDLDFPFFALPAEKNWDGAGQSRASKAGLREWPELKGRPDADFTDSSRWMYVYWSPASEEEITRSLRTVQERIRAGWIVVIKASEGQWTENIVPRLTDIGFTQEQLARIVVVTKGKSKDELQALMAASDMIQASGTGTMRDAIMTMARYGTPVTYMGPEWHDAMVANIVEMIRQAPDTALPPESKAYLLGFYEPLIREDVDPVRFGGFRLPLATEVSPAEAAPHFKRLGRHMVENHDAGDRMRRLAAMQDFAEENFPRHRPSWMTMGVTYFVGFALHLVLNLAAFSGRAFDREAARAFSEQRVAPWIEVPFVFADLVADALFRAAGLPAPDLFARLHRNTSLAQRAERVRLAGELRAATVRGLAAASINAVFVTAAAGLVLAVLAVMGLAPWAVLVVGAPGLGALWALRGGAIEQARTHTLINTPADVMLARAMRERGVRGPAALAAARRIVAAKLTALGDVRPGELDRAFRMLRDGVAVATPVEDAGGSRADGQEGASGMMDDMVEAVRRGSQTGPDALVVSARLLLERETSRAYEAKREKGFTPAALATAAEELGGAISRRLTLGYFTPDQAAVMRLLVAVALSLAGDGAAGRPGLVDLGAEDATLSTPPERYLWLPTDPLVAKVSARTALQARTTNAVTAPLVLLAPDEATAETIRAEATALLGVDAREAGVTVLSAASYANVWPLLKDGAGLSGATDAQAAADILRRRIRFEIDPQAEVPEGFFRLDAAPIPADLRAEIERGLMIVFLINQMLGVRVPARLVDTLTAHRAALISA